MIEKEENAAPYCGGQQLSKNDVFAVKQLRESFPNRVPQGRFILRPEDKGIFEGRLLPKATVLDSACRTEKTEFQGF